MRPFCEGFEQEEEELVGIGKGGLIWLRETNTTIVPFPGVLTDFCYCFF